MAGRDSAGGAWRKCGVDGMHGLVGSDGQPAACLGAGLSTAFAGALGILAGAPAFYRARLYHAASLLRMRTLPLASVAYRLCRLGA